MKQKRTCSNCLYGAAIAVNNDILCRKNGAVSPDYNCSKHKFMPEAKSFRQQNYKCINCENFIINTSSSGNTGSTGLCQLFSVRQFDGNTKNACSKFVKRSEREVS